MSEIPDIPEPDPVTIEISDEAVEAAAKSIGDVHFWAARKRNNGSFVDEQDEFRRMARAALEAALPHLGTPEVAE